jgi:hypothetical protein
MEFVKMRKCRDCGKEFPECDLYYDGVEPDIDLEKGQCYWCMVKEAQKKFGKDNVILPDQN